MEDYYPCIELCRKANELYIDLDSIANEEDTFLSMLCNNAAQLDRMGILNLILLASCYGKINNCDPGIEILQGLCQLEIMDYYTKAAIELNLAELYARRHDFEKAKKLTATYNRASYTNYPDLAACIDTINFLIHYSSGNHDVPSNEFRWAGVISETISSDYVNLHCFNLAVVLAARGSYQESLMLCKGIGKKGFSLQMALYHELKQYEKLQTIFPEACSYYLNEIQNVFSCYNESLVHGHLKALEFHISLCMGSLFSADYQESGYSIHPEQLYEFCLNTKGISLEGSYILRQYPSLSALKKRSLFKAADLQEKLAPGNVLLEYLLIRTLNHTYYGVFIVSQNQIDFLRLSTEEELNELLCHFREYLTHPTGDIFSMEDLNDLLQKLWRILILPLKKYLSGVHHLIIAPAGELYHIPFELLVTNSRRDIVSNYQISYLNIGRELAFTAPPMNSAPVANPLIIGNPLVNKLPDLPFAVLETQEVGKLLQAPVHIGSDASKELFYQMDFNPSLLHIAAHGFINRTTESLSNTGNPASFASNHMKECGLYLAGDEPLTADEISSLQLSNVHLSVLSACYSGLGQISGNEGSFGLRRGFFLAGCHHLLISLWSIHDFAGMLLVKIFYKGLFYRHLSTASALREAQHLIRTYTVMDWMPYLHELKEECPSSYITDMIKAYSYQNEASIPFAHPYYWAGYILIGEDNSLS